uniref:Uncharacterized protein n=1 Tax=Grammatophora oceanica TaxID=210454 RepID=A0A7S1UNH8_9STRA
MTSGNSWFQAALEDLALADRASETADSNDDKTALPPSKNSRMTAESKVEWTKRKVKIKDGEMVSDELLKEAAEQQALIEQQGSYETPIRVKRLSCWRAGRSSRDERQQQQRGPTTVKMLLGNSSKVDVAPEEEAGDETKKKEKKSIWGSSSKKKEDSPPVPEDGVSTTKGEVAVNNVKVSENAALELEGAGDEKAAATTTTPPRQKERKFLSSPLFGTGRKNDSSRKLQPIGDASQQQESDTPPPPPPSTMKKKRSATKVEPSPTHLFRRKPSPKLATQCTPSRNDGTKTTLKKDSSSLERSPVTMIPSPMPKQSLSPPLFRNKVVSSENKDDGSEEEELDGRNATITPDQQTPLIGSRFETSKTTTKETPLDATTAPPVSEAGESAGNNLSDSFLSTSDESGDVKSDDAAQLPRVPPPSTRYPRPQGESVISSASTDPMFGLKEVGSLMFGMTFFATPNETKEQQESSTGNNDADKTEKRDAVDQIEKSTPTTTTIEAPKNREERKRKEKELEAFIEHITTCGVDKMNPEQHQPEQLPSKLRSSLTKDPSERKKVTFSPSTTSKRKGKGPPKRVKSRAPPTEIKRKGRTTPRFKSRSMRVLTAKHDTSSEVPNVGYSADPASVKEKKRSLVKRYFAKKELCEDEVVPEKEQADTAEDVPETEQDDTRRALDIWKSRGALTEDDDLNERIVQDNSVLLSTMLMLEKSDLAPVEMEYAPFLHNHDRSSRRPRTTKKKKPSRKKDEREAPKSSSPRSVARKPETLSQSLVLKSVDSVSTADDSIDPSASHPKPPSDCFASVAKPALGLTSAKTGEELLAIPLTTRTGSTTECILKTEDDLSTASSRRKERRASLFAKVISSSNTTYEEKKMEDAGVNRYWL